jgi:exosortase
VSVYVPHFLKDQKALIKIGTCLFCLGILYHSVFQTLVYDWTHDPDFSHGFLIPFISLYLVWQRADELERLSVSPRNFGILVILSGLFLLIIGKLAAEYFTQRLSFLILLSGIILFLLGWQHLKLLAFPIVFLIFMIPIPSILLLKITFPMQLFAAKVATAALQLLDIPVLREGNVIHLVENTLEVERACSGIRSLISLLAIGTVLAYFITTVTWQRVVVIFSCFPIAIATNAFRVTMTGVLANYYGMKAAEGFFHGFSGMVLYFAGLILVGIVGLSLSKVTKNSHRSTQTDTDKI